VLKVLVSVASEYFVTFEVLPWGGGGWGGKKITVLWDVTPCSVVEIY
jgi:hypothetical protein